METVEGEFDDYSQIRGNGYFRLSCDQVMSHQTWRAPINWSGFINGKKVEFVQKEDSGSHESCYDFSTLPTETRIAIKALVKAIDEAMRVMD